MYCKKCGDYIFTSTPHVCASGNASEDDPISMAGTLAIAEAVLADTPSFDTPSIDTPAPDFSGDGGDFGGGGASGSW
jgi:uncharacterized membrane protein YgcG